MNKHTVVPICTNIKCLYNINIILNILINKVMIFTVKFSCKLKYFVIVTSQKGKLKKKNCSKIWDLSIYEWNIILYYYGISCNLKIGI